MSYTLANDRQLISYTLILCHLFSTLSFTVVQEKPKCYQTNQNMEDTYYSEMFFLTWENYQLFLMNAPLWIIVFQKAFEATLHFVFSIDSANQHFSWLPLFHLLLNLFCIWIVPQLPYFKDGAIFCISVNKSVKSFRCHVKCHL